jgi:hypothetical protein
MTVYSASAAHLASMATSVDGEPLSDAALVGSVADAISVPRTDPADSFVLHSALELCARSALLPFVHGTHRADARQRIAEVAEQFLAFGDAISAPREMPFTSLAAAAEFLDQSIDHGDLDDVDACAYWLGRAAPANELAPLLADSIVPRLGAAAHAPIYLSLFPRVAPRGEATGELLRGLCRELARNPSWRIAWISERAARPQVPPASSEQLFAALEAAPMLGRPASAFIHPLMSRVDTAHCAALILDPVTSGGDVVERGRVLARFAAWSMLTEPGEQAPYGWSHCLTMPQAVMNIASSCTDPSMALAVAATYVLGFRVSLADQAVDTTPRWSSPQCTLAEAIATSPTVARAVAWQLPAESFRDAMGELATFAAVHHDAHLAKYTLACFDAAADDPAHRRLFLTAAATLAGWWSAHPEGQAI